MRSKAKEKEKEEEKEKEKEAENAELNWTENAISEHMVFPREVPFQLPSAEGKKSSAEGEVCRL